MLQFLRTYFGFTRREQRGVVVLMILIFLIWAVRIAMPYFITATDLMHGEQQMAHVLEWEKSYRLLLEKDSLESLEKKKRVKEKKLKKNEFVAELFPFDPNSLSIGDWQRLGLSKKQALVIQKYLDKGGRFYKAEDLKKMYVISPDFFKRVSPYINIKDISSEKTEKNQLIASTDSIEKKYHDSLKVQYVGFYDTLMVDLNSADSALLCLLPGIGPSFSTRIIKYRTRLGGFHNEKQLLEVYGMDTTRLNKFKAYIKIDPVILRTYNLNKVEFNELLKHPYMEYYIVKAIFTYRDEHGDFKKVDELNNVKLVYSDLYDRMYPYLRVEN